MISLNVDAQHAHAIHRTNETTEKANSQSDKSSRPNSQMRAITASTRSSLRFSVSAAAMSSASVSAAIALSRSATTAAVLDFVSRSALFRASSPVALRPPSDSSSACGHACKWSVQHATSVSWHLGSVFAQFDVFVPNKRCQPLHQDSVNKQAPFRSQKHARRQCAASGTCHGTQARQGAAYQGRTLLSCAENRTSAQRCDLRNRTAHRLISTAAAGSLISLTSRTKPRSFKNAAVASW